jgi:3-isopropylmalate/(R)-2-methylmalate dehydratase large subunit
LALHILAALSAGGGKGCAIEYCGTAIEALEMEARMTLCNMAAELSAFSAIIAADERTFAYLKDRPYAPKGAQWEAALAHWRTLRTDPDAVFDRDIVIDAADVAPMVTWGVSPQQASPINARVPPYDVVASRESNESYRRGLDYMGLDTGDTLEGLKIDAAFIGSCTNSRISDLRAAASILRGRMIAAGVKAICVPGSSQVKQQAEAEGLDRAFTDAGFEWRESGCSMCFFAGGESFAPKARVISSTNRNFENRQGPQTRTHLASPAVVAASAIAGAIADPRKLKAST